ncbi:MAG: polysaccharide biosynthesis/export family protein [Verrucomicrobiae bacterium]|nr:polysaccharide biosynthesis/export family protein [Verrucomicrobiae bacterium]
MNPNVRTIATVLGSLAMVVSAIAGPVSETPRPVQEQRKSHTSSAYKLGAGDALRFRLHGAEGLEQVSPISPDGTVSYLQAKQIRAAGLSVPQLREKMEQALAVYHREPKLIVTPVQLASKRYTILGSIRERGTFALNRTTTLLEAIANSKGFESKESSAGVNDLADLKRSFVMRDGKRLPVDIERLYAGDMRHNVVLRPDDYIYIASNQNREAYVLGAVSNPGRVQLSVPTTVTGAVAMAAGFDNQKAWKNRVLLVRGSMTAPQSKVINLKAVLRGAEQDPVLAPGDIVYVHTKPWAFAEDIIDVAAQSFMQGAIVAELEDRPAITVGGFQ